MIYRFAPNSQPCMLKCHIEVSSPNKDLFICGYDPDSEFTEFFWRKMNTAKGIVDYEFNMPDVTDNLEVMVFSDTEYQNQKSVSKDILRRGQPVDYRVQLSDLLPLQVNYTSDKITEAFLRFAKVFCLKAGSLPLKTYVDGNKLFTIEYLPALYENGRIVNTPARIHTATNIIQVCRPDILKLTVPGRKIILCHEYAHNYLNDDIDNESEADIRAAKVLLDHGAPRLDSILAFTSIFSDNEESYKRLLALDDVLKSYISK